MPNYKQILLEKKMTQKELAVATRAVDPRVDESMISKFSNYVCLPTPKVATVLCESLSCNMTELYQKDEITFPKKENGKASTPTGYTNIHIQITIEQKNRILTKETLHLLGYKNQTDLFRDMLNNIDSRIKRLKEKSSKKED